MEYTEGDVNSDAKGSGARANKGKIDLTLVPMLLLGGVTRVFMGGCLKYADWNWAHGMQWSSAMACTLRHLFKWWYLREDIDPESREHHLDHVLANVFMLKHYTKAYSEGDNRPPTSTLFGVWIEDFCQTFDEEAYFQRNPEIQDAVAKRKATEKAIALPSEIPCRIGLLEKLNKSVLDEADRQNAEVKNRVLDDANSSRARAANVKLNDALEQESSVDEEDF